MVLEQLAENEQNALGDPSELDFFLSAGTGAGALAGATDVDGTALPVGHGDGGSGEKGDRRMGGTGEDGAIGRSDIGAAAPSES